MEKVELSNKDGIPITNVGELKRVLEPFIDSCEISPTHVFYVPLTADLKGPAMLEIGPASDEYTQGICQDGAAILKNGVPMAIEEILHELRKTSRY